MTNNNKLNVLYMDSKIYNENGSSRVKESKYNLLWNIDIPLDEKNNTLIDKIKAVVDTLPNEKAKLFDRSSFLYTSKRQGAYLDVFTTNGKVLLDIAEKINSTVQNIYTKDGSPFSLLGFKTQIEKAENSIKKGI